jgi:hypothetical protein
MHVDAYLARPPPVFTPLGATVRMSTRVEKRQRNNPHRQGLPRYTRERIRRNEMSTIVSKGMRRRKNRARGRGGGGGGVLGVVVAVVVMA